MTTFSDTKMIVSQFLFLLYYLFVKLSYVEREESHKHTEIRTHRHKHTNKKTQPHRQPHSQTATQPHRQTEIQIPQTEIQIHRHRQADRHKDRHTNWHTSTDTQTHRQTDKDTQTHTHAQCLSLLSCFFSFSLFLSHSFFTHSHFSLWVFNFTCYVLMSSSRNWQAFQHSVQPPRSNYCF